MRSPWAVIIVVAYFAILALVVFRWGKTRERGLTEFAAAGRSSPWFLIFFTVMATWIVGATYTAWFGYAVTDGMIGTYVSIYGVFSIVILYFIGPRIWVWGKVHDLYNLPDYIGLRYGDRKLAILVAAAGFIIGAPWQITALKTFGYVSSAITYGAVPQTVSIAFFTVVVGLYCIYGGMRSVVVTDFFQGIIAVVVVLGGVIAAVYIKFDGFGGMFQQLLVQKPEMLVINDVKVWINIVLVSVLGSYCWLEIFNRIFVAKGVREIKILAFIAPAFMFILNYAVMLLGVGGSLLPSVNATVATAESGFFTIFSEVGGPILLAFAGIVAIAAEMSSVDSQITTGGVVIARNVISASKKEELTEEQIIKYTRWIIGIWMVICYFLTIQELPQLIHFAVVSYEFLAPMFATIILGIIWRRPTAIACWTSLIVGWLTCTVLQLSSTTHEFLGSWGAGLTGAVFATIVFTAIALGSKKSEKIEALFDEVDKFTEAK
jgi:SSS family solute:Na+ symporter